MERSRWAACSPSSRFTRDSRAMTTRILVGTSTRPEQWLIASMTNVLDNLEARNMNVLFAVYGIALTLGSGQVWAHGNDPHHPGHDDTFGKPGDPTKVSR